MSQVVSLPELAVERWAGYWDECDTDAHYGEQAIFTILLVRDDPDVARRVRTYLENLARETLQRGERVEAYYLLVGATLLDHNPTPEELEQIANETSVPKPGGPLDPRPRGTAVPQAAARKHPFVVMLNRLVDAKYGTIEHAFSQRGFSTKDELRSHIADELTFPQTDARTVTEGPIACHVWADVPGVVEGSKGTTISSFCRPEPFLVTRDRGQPQKRTWHRDVRDLLRHNIPNDTPTVGNLVSWHTARTSDAGVREWLYNCGKKPKGLRDLELTMASQLREYPARTRSALAKYLKMMISEVNKLKENPKHGNYRNMQRWCDTINSETFAACASEAKKEDSWWMVTKTCSHAGPRATGSAGSGSS
jgi:hypothetical protein